MHIFKIKIEILFAILAVFVLIRAFPVFAEEEEAAVLLEEETVDLDETAEPDALLMRYLDNALHAGTPYQLMRSSSYNGSRLEGMNRQIYDSLKSQIEQVAAGNLTYTRITAVIGESEFYGQRWSAEDLGLESLGQDQSPTYGSAMLRQVMCQVLGFDPLQTFLAVRGDCPYEMYWSGLRFSYGYPYTIEQIEEEYYVVFSGSVRFSIYTAPDYAVNGPGSEATASYTDADGNIIQYDPYHVDPFKTGTVGAAIANAKAIVAQNPYTEDYDILFYYFDTIRSLSAYNYEAASATPGYPGGYGDPWQIIYLFDGDPSTTVVCEGFSKGMQYLCEMTYFASGAFCYSVTGELYNQSGTDLGYHMWNIVRMDDGKNYVIDLTNQSSLGTAAFLAPRSGGSVDDAYWIAGKFRYVYDDDYTRALYFEEELTLSETEYRYPAAIALSVNETDSGIVLAWADDQFPDGYMIYRSSDGTDYTEAGRIEGGDIRSFIDTEAPDSGALYYEIVSYKTGPNGVRTSMPAAAETCRLAPCVLTRVNNSPAGISLTWKTEEPVDGFEIYRREPGEDLSFIGTADGTQTVFIDTFDFSDGVLYGYCVRSYKTAGENVYYSSFSEEKQVCALTTPVINKLGNLGQSIRVYWNVNSQADGYVIYRQNAGGSYPAIKNTKDGTVSFWNDTNALEPGKKYSYKMRTYKTVEGVTYYSGYAEAVFTYRLDLPEPPAVRNNTWAVTLNWKKDPYANGYVIYRSIGNGDLIAVRNYSANTTVSWNDTAAVTDGEKYCYKMRSYKTVNGISYYSPYSDLSTIYRLARPVITGTSGVSGGVKVTWDKVNRADGYYIYRNDAGGAFKKIKTITSGATVSYTDTAAVKTGTQYKYQIVAYKTVGGVTYTSASSAASAVKK